MICNTIEANGVNPINDEGGGSRSNRLNALFRPTVINLKLLKKINSRIPIC